MNRYEVWGREGAVKSFEDKSLAVRAMLRMPAPAGVALGASLLCVRDGTTPKQRAAIEHALSQAHPDAPKVDVPKPGDHFTPSYAGKGKERPRAAAEEDEDELDDTSDEPELEDDDDDDAGDDAASEQGEAPTTDAPREPAPTEPPPPAPADAAPACAVLGCTEPREPKTPKTPKGTEECCRRHRKSGAWIVACGRSTAQDLVKYLSEGPHVHGPKAKKPARKTKKAKPLARKAPPSVPLALAATGESITATVTVPLPPEVARAAACAARLGGVEQLERLVAAVLAIPAWGGHEAR